MVTYFANRSSVSNIKITELFCDWLERLFSSFGRIVAKQPVPFIVAPVFLTLSLCFGFFCFDVKDDLRFLYTQSGSPSLTEYEVVRLFEHEKGGSDVVNAPENLASFYVLFAMPQLYKGIKQSNEQVNLLSEASARLFLSVDQFILNNLTVRVIDRRNREFMLRFGEDFCDNLSLCQKDNEAAVHFLNARFDKTLNRSAQILFTYPVMYIFRTKVYLAGNLYGVWTRKNGSGDIVNGFSVFLLTYTYNKIRINASFHQFAIENAVEQAVDEYLTNKLRDNSLPKHELYSLNILRKEITKNTLYTIVLIPVSICALVIFVFFTTFTFDTVTSKPLEGICGLTTSLLAILSAMGFIFLLGVPYNSTVSVMPFLTLALAVDDTFIILSAWHHTSRKLSIEDRLALTLKESGSAITVAALTDVFSFLIGSFADSPAISAFCQFTAASVTFDYIYQMTFFCGFVVLGAKREAADKHCLLFWLPAKDVHSLWSRKRPWRRKCKHFSDDFELVSKLKAGTMPAGNCSSSYYSFSKKSGLRPTTQKTSEKVSDYVSNPIERLFKFYYTDFLSTPCVRISILLTYIIFLAWTFWGCVFIRVNLTPSKVLVYDSPLNNYVSIAEEYIWKKALIGTVYVDNSPDFRNVTQRKIFSSFVTALETSSFSMGANSTIGWFKEFERYLTFFKRIDDSDYYKKLLGFLELSNNEKYNDQIIWNSTSGVAVTNKLRQSDNLDPEEYANLYISKLKFYTAFSINDWSQRSMLVRFWRDHCAKPEYSFMRAIVYNENNFYVDQMDSLASNTVQDCGIAFSCMAIVCGLFIRDRIVLFWVLWSLFAMNMNVIGMLAWWKCDLDPSSVTSILMSVGLTVDFTAHVGYHYSKSNLNCHKEKLRHTLILSGWPLIQGGLSTLISIVSLLLVKSYTVQVFFRTMLLVILSGVIHALLFLPVLFSCTTTSKARKVLR